MLSRAVLLLLSVLLGDLPGCLHLDLESVPRTKTVARAGTRVAPVLRAGDRAVTDRVRPREAARDTTATGRPTKT